MLEKCRLDFVLLYFFEFWLSKFGISKPLSTPAHDIQAEIFYDFYKQTYILAHLVIMENFL